MLKTITAALTAFVVIKFFLDLARSYAKGKKLRKEYSAATNEKREAFDQRMEVDMEYSNKVKPLSTKESVLYLMPALLLLLLLAIIAIRGY